MPRSRRRSRRPGGTPKRRSYVPACIRLSPRRDAEAEDHAAFIDTLPKEIDSLSLLSEVLNFDFSKQPIDEPFTQEGIDSWTGIQGMRDRIRRELG